MERWAIPTSFGAVKTVFNSIVALVPLMAHTRFFIVNELEKRS